MDYLEYFRVCSLCEPLAGPLCAPLSFARADAEWDAPLARAAAVGDVLAFEACLADQRTDCGARAGEALRAAAANGRLDMVTRLLHIDGAHPDTTVRGAFSALPTTALTLAARHGHLDVVRRLLADDRTRVSADGYACLSEALAARRRDIFDAIAEHHSVEEWLGGIPTAIADEDEGVIRTLAEVLTVGRLNSRGKTLLCLIAAAANGSATVAALSQDSWQLSHGTFYAAVRLAATRGHLAALQALLTRPACPRKCTTWDLRMQNGAGVALEAAMAAGHVHAVQWLAAAEKNHDTSMTLTADAVTDALCAAARRRQWACIRVFLQHEAEGGAHENVLPAAAYVYAKANNTARVQEVLAAAARAADAAGDDYDSDDHGDGEDELGERNRARVAPTAALAGYAEAGNLARARALLAGGTADADGHCLRHKTESLRRPLQAACSGGSLAMVQLIIAAAGPAERAEPGKRALWAAVRAGHQPVLELVLKATPRSRTELSRELERAAESCNAAAVELLLQEAAVDPLRAVHGALLGGSASLAAWLLQHPRVCADLAARGAPSARWFRAAIRAGSPRVLQVLLADLRLDPAADGNTAIAWACMHEDGDALALLLKDGRTAQPPPGDRDHWLQDVVFWEGAGPQDRRVGPGLAVAACTRALLQWRLPPADRFPVLAARAEATWQRRRAAVLAWGVGGDD